MVLPDRPMVDHDLVGSPAISRNLSQPGSPPFGTSSVDSRCPTSIWFDQSSSNRYRLRPVDGALFGAAWVPFALGAAAWVLAIISLSRGVRSVTRARLLGVGPGL